MMSLGGLLAPALTLSPVSALPVNEDELVNTLLENIENIDLSEEELDDLLERLGISEDEDDAAVWCYQRQGDVTVCFETQEECQQALD